MTRVAAVLAVVAGVGLIVFTIATSLFSHTAGAQRIIDAFRPAMTREGLASTRADFEIVRDGGVEFITKAEPAFAHSLKLTPAELNAFIDSNFPAVATAVHKIPGYNSYVGSYIGRLERNRTNFEAADSLPLLGLPIDATPWLMAGMGALLALAGLLSLRTGSRGATWAILALGLVLLVVPLIASIPSKATDARDIAHVGRDALTQEKATLAKTGAGQVDALVNEVEGKLVPALAVRLHTTPANLVTQLGQNFPATTRFLAEWKSRLRTKAFAIAAAQQAHVEDFAKADDIPFGALPWILIGPGALLVLTAGLALARRKTSAAS
jgi:hypothetical protein